ncbi:MAG TPA: hypothetical protein VHD60_04510 [Candidatus Saccharimonadales bacterium]|nr:hypothetical protein [Candidatus Saccharimonadales bacterium]
MTKMLSELLGVNEFAFRRGVADLERMSGRPSHDVRISTEVMHGVQAKLRELGLDPHDTTGPELYQALLTKIKEDDKRLMVALLKLSHGKADEDLVSHIAHVLNRLPLNKQCFALKGTVAKRLLKKVAPKRTQKMLGYRSLDSMLKHEAPAALFAAAHLLEGVTWQRSMLDQYKKLQATDFETRDVAIISPSSKRWHDLAEKVIPQKRHNIVSLDELGAIVLLPLPDRPVGATITMAGLSVEAMNEIRASSTYLKLCQVKPDFGEVVRAVAMHEPYLAARMLDRAVPWQLVQRYYARVADAFRADVFEPHIQPADLSWHSVEKVLAHIEPSLEFWHGTSHLGLLHEGHAVSMNILDVALGYCNELPFTRRIVHHMHHNLWHELLLRYFKHDNVEQAVLGELQTELEPALI